MAIVGVSVIVNLSASFIFPKNKRLSESETVAFSLFDILQLAALLFVTGGLNNPFAVLTLAPVAVAASAVRLPSLILLGAVAITAVSILANLNIPLKTRMGYVLQIPEIFILGNWIAITVGLIFVGLYQRRVSAEIQNMSDALTATQMALSREQKLTDLGGVIAAAAHELGTPLATIKLTSSELADDLEDNPHLQEDALLIREQADRCRDILRSMGRAGKGDLHLRSAPFDTVIQEAAEPHLNRGKEIVFDEKEDNPIEIDPPMIQRQPEIIHGMRNLIQNAVDFAQTSVWVELSWSDTHIGVRVVDDGPGYPPQMIGRIGDPFMRFRKTKEKQKSRPEYEGMGLGLFIAKTLLERSGATLTFANGSSSGSLRKIKGKPKGAIVDVSWPLERINAPERPAEGGLGANIPFEV
jgi:two-component system sensor histidine kinase RegB